MHRALLALSYSLVACAIPGLAAAAERQHHLALAPTGSLIKTRNHALSPGLGATAMYTYGLTDQFNLLAEASQAFLSSGSSSVTPLAPFIRPGFMTTGAVGAAYVLDVLSWVPYGGLLVSGNLLGGGTMPNAIFLPDAQVALGLDYQFTRHLVGGVGFRQHVFFTRLKDYPSYSSLFLKIEWQWGY